MKAFPSRSTRPSSKSPRASRARPPRHGRPTRRQRRRLTKAKKPGDRNTAWAQGGIIYFGKKDSPRSLVRDILRAGAGLCHPEAVAFLARRGPEVVKDILLDTVGVPFSR